MCTKNNKSLFEMHLKKFGDWKNDGACVATEKHGGLCGPQLGKQKQKRTCQDGTNDKCTEENTNQ